MLATETKSVDVIAALEEVKQQFIARNPKSHMLHLEACSVMPGGNARTVLFYAPFQS